ncbi:sugar phosphate isomerase/epimerase family protein [Pedobacter lithocola]|uniref:Sugar phosphate isomerase/epimerase family protein n=1 Tax=Pedobacter lithocola TaxID=1908239 RepID=A0ABV8PE39_9SPHI
MEQINRKKFIKYSGIVLGALSLAYKLPDAVIKGPKLSFSTLGCPKWDLPQILDFASKYDYQGVEIRIIAGELDLNKSLWFSEANMASTKRMISDKGLIITDLGSSAHMHYNANPDRDKNLDEAKKYIDLAQRLGSKYVRVFPEKLLSGEARKASLDTIATNLKLLGNYASQVMVLLESHGELVEMNELQYVMQQAENHNVGMIWDIHNMWAASKQSPAEVCKKLAKYIRHVHVKDAKVIDGKEHYVLLGQGDVPLKEAFDSLKQVKYKGFYSLEWEKLWHPELEEPEIALAQYPDALKRYF